MNILRLVVAEKEKKNRPQSEEFKALEKVMFDLYRYSQLTVNRSMLRLPVPKTKAKVQLRFPKKIWNENLLLHNFGLRNRKELKGTVYIFGQLLWLKNSELWPLYRLSRPFSGKYLRQKEQGIYVCIVCENPIFASECKYDSHCGWPSFNDVIAQGKVSVAKDGSHGT